MNNRRSSHKRIADTTEGGDAKRGKITSAAAAKEADVCNEKQRHAYSAETLSRNKEGNDDEVTIKDEHEITPATREYFNQLLCDRLNRCNAFSNVSLGRASLHTVQYDLLQWGPVGYGRTDKSHELFYAGRPLHLRAVVELVHLNLRNTEGEFLGMPRRRPGIMFAPLLQSDFEMAGRILFDKAAPIDDQIGKVDGFWANKFMGSPNLPGDKVPILDRVYDATASFKPKNEMPIYSAEDLKIGDIVLIEMTVVRWVPRDQSSRGTNAASSATRWYKGKRIWRSWVVDFKLDAISLLYSGPDYFGIPQDDDYNSRRAVQ